MRSKRLRTNDHKMIRFMLYVLFSLCFLDLKEVSSFKLSYDVTQYNNAALQLQYTKRYHQLQLLRQPDVRKRQNYLVSSRSSTLSLSSIITEEITEELPSFISDSVFGDIASQVQSRVKVPPIPSPIIRYVLSQVLRSMCNDLSPAILCQIEELLDSEKTSTKDDDMKQEDVNQLIEIMAQEMMAKNVIDVPILNSKQEYEILVQILSVMFSILTTSESERRMAMIQQAQQFLANDLLGTPEGRKLLIQRINAAIDIPFLNEEQEEKVSTVAIEAFASTLQLLFPPDILKTLKGETDSNSVVEMKQFVIHKVNENIDLIGFNEQQEEAFIRTIVDLLIESYVDPTAAELLLLHKNSNEILLSVTDNDEEKIQQQIKTLQTNVAAIQRKITLSTTRYEREQNNLKIQLKTIQQQIEQLEDRTAKEVNLE